MIEGYRGSADKVTNEQIQGEKEEEQAPHPAVHYGHDNRHENPYRCGHDSPYDIRNTPQRQEPRDKVIQLWVPERQYGPPIADTRTTPSDIFLGSTRSTSGVPSKRPKVLKEPLELWVSLHLDDPYPTEEKKNELAAEAEMTMTQVIHISEL